MPQPPFTAEAFRLALLMVVMCFKMDTSFVFSRRGTSRAGAVSCYYSQYTILCRIFQVLIENFLGQCRTKNGLCAVLPYVNIPSIFSEPSVPGSGMGIR